jgi:hypothetical protein
MGYSGEEMAWHGFITIASACLNELTYSRQLMQAWADYLDDLRKNTANDAAEIASPGRFSLARSA